MSQQSNSSNQNLLSFLGESSQKIKEKTLQSCNSLLTNLRKVVSQIVQEPTQNHSQTDKSVVVDNPVSPFIRKASSSREDLSKFGSLFLRNILSKNHEQFQLFKSKISNIRHRESNPEERQPTSGSELSLLKVSQKQSQFIPETETVQPVERQRILGGRSSTKSIKLTENGSEEEQPFNLTAKSRSRLGRPNLSQFHNDSLTYSQTGDMSRTLQRRLMSPEKKSDTSQIIPHELKYGPDSPKKRINSPPETILEAQDSLIGRQEPSNIGKQQAHDPVVQQESPSKLDLIKKEVEEITKKNTITQADLELQPEIQESTEELRVQAQTEIITKKPEEVMNNASQNWASSRSISRHRVRLQKQMRKGYQPNRAESVQSRTNTENSQNISSSRRISSNDNKKANIFSTEIDNYKERIELLHKAKSRKKLLEEQLANLNQQIDDLKNVEEQNPKTKNKIKEFIGISDDHEARVRAAQLVNRLNKQRVKRQQDILRNFGQVDGNIIESINELTKLREEREKKLKEQKKLEIVQRMKQHERKKQEDQKLKQASNQFVHQIKQEHTEASMPTEAAQRMRKPTEPLPELTPQLSLKKQRLRKVRKLNYVSKKAVGDEYTTLLFKN